MNEGVQASAAPRPVGRYPHARRVGDLLFLSGIGPRDAATDAIPNGIEAQTRQTLDNLVHSPECAGLGLEAVPQVLIYVTDRSYLAAVNAIYGEYFQAPYPNRAAVVVAGLAREEMLVELVVYACL